MAPSGVVLIGFALVFRDWLHEVSGERALWNSMGAILLGTLISFLVASPFVAIASASAFLASEVSDLLVYSPLRRKNLVAALAMSSLVGAVVDSAIFLLIAFGSLEFLPGQVIGKLWAALVAATVLIAWRRRANY